MSNRRSSSLTGRERGRERILDWACDFGLERFRSLEETDERDITSRSVLSLVKLSLVSTTRRDHAGRFPSLDSPNKSPMTLAASMTRHEYSIRSLSNLSVIDADKNTNEYR